MTEEEASDLVQKALMAGMHGDNASGNSYNLVRDLLVPDTGWDI